MRGNSACWLRPSQPGYVVATCRHCCGAVVQHCPCPPQLSTLAVKPLRPHRLNILEAAIKEERWRYCRIDGSVASAAGEKAAWPYPALVCVRAPKRWQAGAAMPHSIWVTLLPSVHVAQTATHALEVDRRCAPLCLQSARRACASSRPPPPSRSSCSPARCAAAAGCVLVCRMHSTLEHSGWHVDC